MKYPKQYIGGFFELESDFLEQNEFQYHDHALALSSGRSCLSFLCKKLRIKKIFVPFYTCNALLEPLLENKIAIEFYSLNHRLELTEYMQLGDDEYIVYINYFGLKRTYCRKLLDRFGVKLILDNTQSFFEKGCEHYWSFNSARKFFGVPDGAYLYGPDLSSDRIETNPFYQSNHLLERKFGDQQIAYEKYIQYERTISTSVYRMSNVSGGILTHLNLPLIREKRIWNFNYYQEAFRHDNQFATVLEEDEVPFCYPLLLKEKIDSKILHQANIFTPTLWRDVGERNHSGFEFEKQFSTDLLALPLDHRYDEADCERVVHLIRHLQENQH